MRKETKAEKIIVTPLESSLGHLAYGDIAFKAWRKIKKENNKKVENEKK